MKSIKYIILFVFATFAMNNLFAQGCEGPGEGDGIKIFGFVQPTFQYNITGENGEINNDQDDSRFFFKRARLGVMGNIPYDFSYYFIAEFSPEVGAGIMDAYVSYNRFKYVKFSLGQFKAPFGAEQMQACHKLYTIDRSMVVNNLAGPIRDLGFTVFGTSGDAIKLGKDVKDVITYNFAMMNGEGRNAKDISTNKAYLGRITLTPMKGITLGGSYKYNQYTPNASVVEDNTFNSFGFDAQLNFKNFYLQGEYISSVDKGDISAFLNPESTGGTSGGGSGDTGSCGKLLASKAVEDTTTPAELKRSGYYITALYKTKWNLEPVVKYETYDPTDVRDYDAQSRWTAGISYFFNEWTRLQVNYQYNFEQVPERELANDAFQIQLQAIIK